MGGVARITGVKLWEWWWAMGILLVEIFVQKLTVTNPKRCILLSKKTSLIWFQEENQSKASCWEASGQKGRIEG